MEIRTCISCGESKPIEEFSTYRARKTREIRFANKCLVCYREYQRKALLKLYRKQGRKVFQPIEERTMKHCAMCNNDFPRTPEYFYRNKASKDGLMYQCKECNKKYSKEAKPKNPVVAHNATHKWRQTEPGKRWHSMSLAQSRAMKRTNGPYERIYRAVVWERDGGICHICKQPCDPDKWHMDHIIPISRGGTHTYDNVAVSHVRCNIRKKDKLLSEL